MEGKLASITSFLRHELFLSERLLSLKSFLAELEKHAKQSGLICSFHTFFLSSEKTVHPFAQCDTVNILSQDTPTPAASIQAFTDAVLRFKISVQNTKWEGQSAEGETWRLPTTSSAAPPSYSSPISKLHHRIKNIAPGGKPRFMRKRRH